MELIFTKMQAAGNDYIYLDCRSTGLPPEASAWAVQLSQRHFAVGADGLICIGPPILPGGDACMYIFNADGSAGGMCGNGVRCVAEFLYTHGLPKEQLRIDTPNAGQRILRRIAPRLWQADMGRFTYRGPACLTAAGRSWPGEQLWLGNPHFVVFCRRPPTGTTLARHGQALAAHPFFPEGSNVEFVRRTAPDALTVTVWERGSGATLACGTGACAAAAAAVLTGRCPRERPIAVTMPGGTLTVEILLDDTALLTGEVRRVFDGRYQVGG